MEAIEKCFLSGVFENRRFSRCGDHFHYGLAELRWVRYGRRCRNSGKLCFRMQCRRRFVENINSYHVDVQNFTDIGHCLIENLHDIV